MSELERFIERYDQVGDDVLKEFTSFQLRKAYSAAQRDGLVGWEETIWEYIEAAESGRPLNRPLDES